MSKKLNNRCSKIGDGEAEATPRASACEEATSNHPADRPADAKPCASPSAEEVKERLRTESGPGPDRPLAWLAYVEKELEIRSAALTRLSDTPKRRPDKNLLVHQLVRTTDTSAASITLAPKLRSETVGLYSALPCEDATDSILNRIIVGSANTVMACQARAMQTRNPQAIDINLRHAARIAKVLIELVEARERRRGPRRVVVGNVNVEAGAQALFGTVETRPRKSDDEEPDEA